MTKLISTFREHANAPKTFLAQTCYIKQRTRLKEQTPWSRILPEKLTVPRLLEKFTAFYGTRRFITAFTTDRHLSLFWAKYIHSMPPSHSSKTRFNIILPSKPGSFKWSPSPRFPHQNPVCTSPLPHTCYISCPYHYLVSTEQQLPLIQSSPLILIHNY